MSHPYPNPNNRLVLNGKPISEAIPLSGWSRSSALSSWYDTLYMYEAACHQIKLYIHTVYIQYSTVNSIHEREIV